MSLILTTTLPLFVLILAGFIAGRRGLIDAGGIRGLTSFVYWFALPLTLFYTMASAPVAEEFDGRFVLAYLACGITVHLAGMAIARWVFKAPLSGQSIQGFAASFGNLVFIALPISQALFGSEGALPMTLLIATEGAVIMPFTVALLEIERQPPGKAWKAPLVALGALVRNPLVMSVVLGAIVAVAGIGIPSLLEGLIVVVRGANVPCALFALGASLAALRLSERLAESTTMVALKLFAYPALVYLAMTALLPDLPPAWQAIAVLSAAMPMGANVFLLAARYNAYVARASSAVLFSTALSVVTVSILALLLAE